MLPKIAQLEFDDAPAAVASASAVVHKTFDWDFDLGDFRLQDGKVVEVEGLVYLRIWIQKAILSDQNLQSLVGQNLHPDYTRSEFERMITEILLQNEAITAVENFSFAQKGAKLVISFDVSSIFGGTQEAVAI